MSNYNQRFKQTIWKERDIQGNLIHSKYEKDIFVPFKVAVPAGHSTFDVLIEKTYFNRHFSFEELYLVPTLYSDAASAYNLETDAQLDEVLSYEIFIRANIDPRNKFYGEAFTGVSGTKTTKKLIRDANLYFEYRKPAGILHLAGFFDWMDQRYNALGDETFDAYVKKMALVYYGEPYSVKIHFNALPPSARSIYGVNNYLFPTELTKDNLENLRWRINIAPNSAVSFSTNGHLQKMGFSDFQIGEQTGDTRNFVWENEEKTQYSRITADLEMDNDLVFKATEFKMHFLILTHNFFSEPVIVSLTRRESFFNENFETAVKNALDEIAQQCNLIYQFSYNGKVKKFSFFFPTNVNMRQQTIMLVPELSQRLGYSLVTDISEGNKESEKVDDHPDPEETLNKARSLAYDTSVVIVSNAHDLFHKKARTADFMASLFPTDSGSMEMRVNAYGLLPPYLIFSPATDTAAAIPIKFQLSAYSDENVLVNFQWKEGAFIIGILRGMDPSSKM